MFGIFGFIVGFGFANCYWIVAIGVIALSLKQKKKIPWRPLIPILLIQVVASYLLLPQFYSQIENYFFLKNIKAAEVVSIQVDSSVWTTHQDIEIIVEKLNQNIWHQTSHDSGGLFVTMSIKFQSGKVWNAHVGRYDGKDGALLEFFWPENEQSGYWVDGTYVPGLMSTFENLGYSLPVR